MRLLIVVLVLGLASLSLAAEGETKKKDKKLSLKDGLPAVVKVDINAKLEEQEKKDNPKDTQEEIETYFEIDGKLKLISKDLLASNLTQANKHANEAVLVLKKRRAALLVKRRKCGLMESVTKRRVCFVYVQDQVKKLREEHAMLGDLRKCNGFAAGDVAKLVACVNEVKERFSLLSPNGVPKKAKSKDGLGKKRLHAMIMAVSGDDAMAEREVEEAVAEIRERLESLAGQWSMCGTLATKEMRVGCRQAIAKQRKDNAKERKLLHQLERCGEVYAFEDKARDRCAHLIGRKILRLLIEQNHKATSTRVIISNTTKSPIVNLAPNNMPQLRREKKIAARKIKDRIGAILSAMEQCKSLACKKKLHKHLARARDELKVLGVRYKPRKECLQQRAAFQKREFEIRAREHARMYQLHRKASRCETRQCVRKWQRLESGLDKVLAARRAERHSEWLRIKCYYVLPYALVSPETKSYKSMAGLHYKVHQLYQELSKCSKNDHRCISDVKFEIKLFRGMIHRLTRYLQEKGFTNAIRRHKDRARLHRSFAMLYRRALDCQRNECRRHARIMLNHLQQRLEERRNDWRVGTDSDALDFHAGTTGDNEEGEGSLDYDEADN